MKFQLIFDQTGDSIPFVSVNPAALEYYVDQLNQQDLNHFSIRDTSWSNRLESNINALDRSIITVNEYLEELTKQKFEFDGSLLNQQILNRLHSEWVRLSNYSIHVHDKDKNTLLIQQLHDMIPDELLTIPLCVAVIKLGKDDEYNNINLLIHKIESSFTHINYKVSDQFWVEFPNPFKKTEILSNDHAHFRLHYNHLGRILYEKYSTFGNDPLVKDDNTYNEMLGFVSLHFVQQQTIGLSPEYIMWCKEHGYEPVGNYLNFGNIPDIDDRLTDYRQIIYRNAKIDTNFSIQIQG